MRITVRELETRVFEASCSETGERLYGDYAAILRHMTDDFQFENYSQTHTWSIREIKSDIGING